MLIKPRWTVICVLAIGLAPMARRAGAATAPEDPKSGDAGQEVAEPNTVDNLATEQGQLAQKYALLETLMLRTAEFDSGRNPRRSALLRQALAQSKDKHVRLQLDTLVTLLKQKKLSPALESQNQVVQDLKTLLELLLTENRSDRLKSEQQRVRAYIKELERIIRLQRGVQGRTEGGEDKDRLAGDQGRVADRAAQLGQEIDQNEGDAQAAGQDEDATDQGAQDKNPEDTQRQGQGEQDKGEQDKRDDGKRPSDQDRRPEDAKDRDGQEQDGRQDGKQTEPRQAQSPGQGQPKSPGQGQPKSPGQGQPKSPGQGQPQSPGQGQPQSPGQGQQPNPGQGETQPQNDQQGQEGPPSPSQEQYPGRQRIAEAEQKMREAQKRLDQAQRKDAVDDQQQARRLLEEAKAELEKILRQLREEEIERMLAMLESRFRKMLQMQLKVYESTKNLDQTPAQRRDRQIDIQAGKLSLQERRIVVEADKALALLRQEGSSVAFPEAVGQMRDDMQQVVQRLARSKIGAITQSIEEDIIAALEEAIQALQQAQEDQNQRKNQQAPPPPSQPQDPPLVDVLAELKLVKALQIRVNKRTNRYARLLADMDDPVGQASDDELIEALENLSEREKRLFGITRDIDLGRNK